MNQKNLKKFEKLLIIEREKILEQLGFEKDRIAHLQKKEIGDLVDDAFNMYEKIRTIDMSENDKKILKAIDDALLRIKNKRFGICIRCNQEIDETRLTAIPWTLNCVHQKICNRNQVKKSVKK